jgi:hypothetical protein
MRVSFSHLPCRLGMLFPNDFTHLRFTRSHELDDPVRADA